MKTNYLVRALLSGMVAVAAGAAFLPAVSADEAVLTGKDKSFIQDAYEDGLGEVQTAQLAQKKTGNPDVKAFAEKLAADHTSGNNELKALADAKKISVANEPSLVAQGKSKLLDGRSGADFDKAYIDAMVSDHKKDIAAFEKAANEVQDIDIKSLANKMLSTLKEHLAAAETIQQKIGK